MTKACANVKQKMFFLILLWGTAFLSIKLTAAEENEIGLKQQSPASVACQIQLGKFRGTQTDVHEVVSFPTFDVLNESLPFEIREQISRAIKLSFVGGKFQEVGFYVFVFNNGTFVPGEIYSSGSLTSLAITDGDASFEDLMKRTQDQEIVRIEHFHTHPDFGPSSLSLSTGDVSAVLARQKRISNRGVDIPFAENAIHTFSRWGTEIGNVRRVEIGPEQVRESRTKIASNLKASRKKRELTFTLPPKTQQIPGRGVNLEFIIEGNIERRQAIRDALDWAYRVEFIGRSDESILRERQGRLMKLPFLSRVSGDSRLPQGASNMAWAVAASLGLQGEVSNSIKLLVDIRLKELLLRSLALNAPEPNALVVYHSEGTVKALAVYRSAGPDGIWRAASRPGMVGDITFEHDWDDVPLDWGTTVKFYRLPPMAIINQLLN